MLKILDIDFNCFYINYINMYLKYSKNQLINEMILIDHKIYLIIRIFKFKLYIYIYIFGKC